MNDLKSHYDKSVMDYITLSLSTIIAIALLVIIISFWVTELADKDAQAINISGSMRMQTYHIGLALEENNKKLAQLYINKLNNTWNNNLFISLHKKSDNTVLNQRFHTAYQHWRAIVKPSLEKLVNQPDNKITTPILLLEKQVALTDELVNQFQADAESKIRLLRSFQVIALFSTIIVGSIIFYLLKNRIEKPLKQLTQTTQAIGKGDFSKKIDIDGRDELALLGAVFNQMTDSLAKLYSDLESRVQERTQELEKNNTTLQFLFNNAKRILNNSEAPLEYDELLGQLNEIINVNKLELCLFTVNGQKPYLHTAGKHTDPNDCGSNNCDNCLSKDSHFDKKSLRISHRFLVNHNDVRYGVINVHSDYLNHWQKKILQSTADQLAIALSLREQKSQEQRLAMLNERTVIARELHDSIAQALSYLQIQVTLLQKSNDKEKYELQQPIIYELREGLSSAYRQLRELLTTFRLKIDAGGLKEALEKTARDLIDKSNMSINLDYQLSNLPLSSAEEIHLLQIVREASQNAIHHSKGQHINISLKQQSDQSIELMIENDGISIPKDPKRLNHYGLAIMKERSRHLGGDIEIGPVETGGTKVSFNFTPTCIKEQDKTA